MAADTGNDPTSTTVVTTAESVTGPARATGQAGPRGGAGRGRASAMSTHASEAAPNTRSGATTKPIKRHAAPVHKCATGAAFKARAAVRALAAATRQRRTSSRGDTRPILAVPPPASRERPDQPGAPGS